MAPVTYDGEYLGWQEVDSSDLAAAITTAFQDERVARVEIHRLEMKQKRDFSPRKFRSK